jgi:hypothetical protein
MLDSSLQLVGLLGMLLLGLIVNSWSCEVDPLEHLDVLLDLLGLLFAAHDIIQRAVVSWGGPSSHGTVSLKITSRDVLGRRCK